MLRYILSISLLLFTIEGFAQKDEPEEKTKAPFEPGLAIGINAGTFIMKAIDPNRIGLEATGRFKINRIWFAVGEMGYEKVDFNKESLQYTSDGSFLRIGADYNFFKVEETDNNDNIIFGLRYGFAFTNYSSSRFTIQDGYWGNYTGSISNANSTAHWAEIVFGLRSEVLKNFYMGWSVRIRSLIQQKSNEQLEPYAIPGFGRSDNATNLSFTYNLEYYIPFSRKSKNK